MKRKLYFFHGYGSGINSSKYLRLKEYFGDRFEMENEVWRLDDNIEQIMSRVCDKLEHEEKPILFGDSTGANFAYQIRERRLLRGKESILIMSAPLLDFSKRISSMDFSKNIQHYLIPITEPKNAMIIIPTRDEVLNHSFLTQNTFDGIELFPIEDTHRLEELKKGVGLKNIEAYINKMG